MYALWIDPEAIAAWFLPPGSNAKWERLPEIDPRPGGTFSLDVRGDDGVRYHIFGRYKTLESPAKLTLEWHWTSDSAILGSGGPTLVTAEIAAVNDGTEVVITHEGFPDVNVRDMYIRGWTRCLRGMEQVLDL